MPSPETEITTAYAQGRDSATSLLSVGSNPYDGSTFLSSQQKAAWAQGWLDKAKDLTNLILAGGLLPQVVSPAPSRWPAMQEATIQIADAAFKTLFSAPFVLLPGRPGFSLVPVGMVVTKNASVAYTTAGVTALNGLWAGSGTTWFGLAAAAFDTFFSSTGITQVIGLNPTFGVYNPTFHAMLGTNLLLSLTGADLGGGGGGGGLEIVLRYRAWPYGRLPLAV